MSDNPANPLESLLSEFALGPSWARAKSDASNKQHTHESAPKEHPQRRRDDRDAPHTRREGGKGGFREDRGQRGRDPRESRDGRRNDFRKGRDRGREQTRREEFIPPAAGVTVSILPDKTAIQLVCKEIHQVARVYPLYDIAEIILAERTRCRANFEIAEPHEPFLLCKIEEALFLTKEEAMRHLLASPWKNQYIEETTVETEAPKGNFQSVARCGISGKILGPPNHHGYQTEIRRHHRECFPEMPFDSFVARIRTDRSEEAVQAWLESMKVQTRWRILSPEETAAIAAAKAKQAETPSESAPEITADQTEPLPSTEKAVEAAAEVIEDSASEETSSGEAPTEETAAETLESEAPQEELSPETEAPGAVEHKWFTDRAEFERALIGELLPKLFRPVRKARLSAAIPGKNLSPGILVKLKAVGAHHRKHPAIIIPDICKILDSEHMPVFKRKGKLFTGPARPNALPPDAVLAERPGQMVKWIRENTPAKLEGLWQAMLPEGSTAPPQGYAADLFWLLQQGHILLYTDDTLVVQDPPKPQEPKKPKPPKAPKQKAAAPPSESSPENPPETNEPPADPVDDPIESTGTGEETSEMSDNAVEVVAEATPPAAETIESTNEESDPTPEAENNPPQDSIS